MLDIEFVRDQPEIGWPVVYCYRSGRLRTKVLEALMMRVGGELPRIGRTTDYGEHSAGGRTQTAEDRQREELSNTLMERSLFELKSRSCDWADLAKPARDALVRSLPRLSSTPPLRFVLLVAHNSSLVKRPDWQLVLENAFLIEEPEVTPETLLPMLRYCEATTTFIDNAALCEQGDFVESFAELVERGHANLATVMQGFAERVLTAVDDVSGEFDASLWATQARTLGSGSALSALRRYLEALSAADWLEFMLVLQQRLEVRRCSRDEAWRELCHLLQFTLGGLGNPRLLMDVASKGDHKASVSSDASVRHVAESILLWAAMVLAKEEALGGSAEETSLRRTADLFVPVLDRIGREHLARMRSDGTDRLAGWWPTLCQRLNLTAVELKAVSTKKLEDSASMVRKLRVLEHFWAALNRAVPGLKSRWVTRLKTEFVRSGVVEAIIAHGTEDGNLKPVAVAQADWDAGFPLRTKGKGQLDGFADCFGQPHVVKRIQDRLSAADQAAAEKWRVPDRGILLHGSPGVGKRSLASLYIKAFRCEARLPDGSPCGECACCRDYEPAGGFGIVAFDAKGATPRIFEAVREHLFNPAFVGPRCIQASNIDEAEPEAVDVILKAVEENDRTLCVLLATDLAKVRLALRSRCTAMQLRPLEACDVKRLVSKRLPQSAQWTPEVLDVVAAAEGGLPKPSLRLAQRVVEARAFDLAGVRKLLELEWLPALIEDWVRLISAEGEPHQASIVLNAVQTKEQVCRTRLLLQVLCLRASGVRHEVAVALHPAFMHREIKTFSAIDAAAAARASRLGTSCEMLLTRLCALWAGGDVSSVQGYFDARKRSLAVFHGDCPSLVTEASIAFCESNGSAAHLPPLPRMSL